MESRISQPVSLTKRQRKGEAARDGEEKKTCACGRKEDAEASAEWQCLILYPNGTGLNQMLVILDHAVA